MASNEKMARINYAELNFGIKQVNKGYNFHRQEIIQLTLRALALRQRESKRKTIVITSGIVAYFPGLNEEFGGLKCILSR